jgi:hypothetical protein
LSIACASASVFGLGEVGDFEAPMFNLLLMFNRSTNVQFGTIAPTFAKPVLAVRRSFYYYLLLFMKNSSFLNFPLSFPSTLAYNESDSGFL